jgi:hypothetical protein
MRIAVIHLGECPPRDKRVGSKHGTHVRPYAISRLLANWKRHFADGVRCGGGNSSEDSNFRRSATCQRPESLSYLIIMHKNSIGSKIPKRVA